MSEGECIIKPVSGEEADELEVLEPDGCPRGKIVTDRKKLVIYSAILEPKFDE